MAKSLFCLLLLIAQSPKLPDHVYLRDNSDWWSTFTRAGNIEPQKIDTSDGNFRILGISLDEGGFSEIPAKFGKATEVSRGDASTGRRQFCYASVDNALHLVFEKGELDYSFYLFSGGPAWKGNEYCLKSSFVSSDISTASGLHLGMSPTDVEAILGKSNAATGDTLVYSRSIRKETSQKDLKKIRERSPNMSEAELSNYRFYDLNVSIEARFAESRLIYLGIAKSETD
ncbi:MAG: hypothetical protein ACXV8M_03435 [Candidatus Angelobacter sp.]